MHLQTHGLTGWLIGNAAGLGVRGRSLAVLAGVLPDLDGLGIVVSEELYWDWHHVLGHNVFYLLAAAGVLTVFTDAGTRCRSFVVFTLVGASHLLLDLIGSGPDWELAWLWPASDHALVWRGAWPLFSWQNILTFVAVLVGTLAVARWCGRTPLEWVMPSLDRRFVRWIRGSRGGGSAVQPGHATEPPPADET